MLEAVADPLLQAPALARLLGGTPAALTLLAGGRNSRVYRVLGQGGETFALKAYFRHPGDPRDRLGTEMAALEFMRAQGITCVPRPLGKDAEAGLGLYEFIEGERPRNPGEREVDACAAFLVSLHGLRHAPGAANLRPASEARFTLRAVADNVEARLRALREGAPALADFLELELVPVWREVLARCQAEPVFDVELDAEGSTLSPSDFGFHNTLVRCNELVFLDFEYFGWDDPAKLIADGLLHPGMELAPSLRIRLAEGVLAGLADQPGLRERVRQAYPLFGIKWCLILLNEFLPGPLGRRQFAAPEDGTAAERQALQLEKTRQKLQWIRDAHDPFTS